MNQDKEKAKEYQKRYKENNPGKVKESQRRWKEKNKEKVKEYSKKYNPKISPDSKRKYRKKRDIRLKKQFPEKLNAWKNDYRKKAKECLTCGNGVNLNFHHTDYKKHQGFTLCRKCHLETHKSVGGL